LAGDTERGDTERKVCLDLFSGLGGFSAAFEDAPDWDVVTVDIEELFDPDIQADVLDLRPENLLEAVGLEREAIDILVILASPPCTHFSLAQQPNPHWDGDTPTSDEVREHIALVHHTIGLIEALNPDYWILENPVGKMRTVLGQPQATVTYCQYGLELMKPTDLWGSHPTMTYQRCNRGEDCHQYDPGRDWYVNGEQIRDPAERAKVPYELSESILEAVECRQEQTKLPVATDGGDYNACSVDTDTEGGQDDE